MNHPLAVKLVWACRIAYMMGLDDITLGHMSARDPSTGWIYMKPYGLGFEEFMPQDVVAIDLEGNQLDGPHPVHKEWPLHTEVMRQDPQVHSVLHAHPMPCVAFTSTDRPLLPLNHDSILFVDGVPFYDENPGLIRTRAEGAAIAHALSGHKAIFLRNHGILVAGKNVEWTLITALTLNRAVQEQIMAESLGPLRTIPEETARSMLPTKYYDALMERHFAYYVRRAIRSGLGEGLPLPWE